MLRRNEVWAGESYHESIKYEMKFHFLLPLLAPLIWLPLQPPQLLLQQHQQHASSGTFLQELAALAPFAFNNFQRNNSHAIWNQQTTGKNRASSLHGEATAHGLLISLRLFGTGFGHVSDYKMKF